MGEEDGCADAVGESLGAGLFAVGALETVGLSDGCCDALGESVGVPVGLSLGAAVGDSLG